MNSQTIIAILATLSASIALADDFKTINGKEYKNATVTRVEPDGIMVRFSGGIVKIPFIDLPKEDQQRFHYDPQAAAAYFVAVQQTNQQIEDSNKQQIEAEQQKALENRLSQLQQQEEDLRAQIGGVNNSTARGTNTDVHERAKLSLGEIASGGGVHSSEAQLALKYEQWAKERALAGNLADAERYNAMADQVKERIPELQSSEKPLHEQTARNASEDDLQGRLNNVLKEKQQVTQELERKKAQRQP